MTQSTRHLRVPLFCLALACGGSIGEMDGADGGPDRLDAGPDSMVGISPSLFELAPGETIALQAVVLDAAGSPMPGATVSWATSSSAAATVTSTGLVTAVAAGSVSITATWERSRGISTGSIVAADAEPDPEPDPDPSCCDAGINNFCMLAPGTAGCPMTSPGGYCDPNGDGSYTEPGTDENWRTGREHYEAFCGFSAQPPGDCCRPADPAVTNFCHLAPDTAGCPMTARGGYCDPDRDADYDANDDDGDGDAQDGDWVHGYFHYQEICGG